MKKLILLAGVALLAACGGKSDTATEAAATESAMATAAATVTPVASATPGVYDVTYPDGSKSMDALMDDGTYVSRDPSGKVVDKGAWAIKDGKTCFTPEGKAEECYTESARAADGSFSATGADGKVTQVKPHAK